MSFRRAAGRTARAAFPRSLGAHLCPWHLCDLSPPSSPAGQLGFDDSSFVEIDLDNEDMAWLEEINQGQVRVLHDGRDAREPEREVPCGPAGFSPAAVLARGALPRPTRHFLVHRAFSRHCLQERLSFRMMEMMLYKLEVSNAAATDRGLTAVGA